MSIFKNYIINWNNPVIKQTAQPMNKKVGKLKKKKTNRGKTRNNKMTESKYNNNMVNIIMLSLVTNE